MRFIVQDYLAHIKERDELDEILPDLLRSMGFRIVKLAFRGEVEHGVILRLSEKKMMIGFCISSRSSLEI